MEFLDSVLESKRAQEASLRKDTAEKLAVFRQHQEELERAALGTGDSPVGEKGETWVASGKKRKKVKDKEIFKGVKLRKTSSSAQKSTSSGTDLAKDRSSSEQKPESGKAELAPTASLAPNTPATSQVSATADRPAPKRVEHPKTSPALALGLGAYSSDED